MTPHVPKAVFNNPLGDYLLVLCPVWVGALYIFLISTFPTYHVQIFAFYLLLLGESHFAVTWLFFNNRRNWEWLKHRWFSIAIVPVFIAGVYVSIGLWRLDSAFLVVGVASGFHVTRQSIGVYRLYGGVKYGISEALIYGFSLFFLVVGFFRFYTEDINQLIGSLPYVSDVVARLFIDRETGAYFLLSTMIAVSVLVKKYSKDWRRWTATMTGSFLYTPYCFVTTPYDAMAIGVGMHWCQYLGLNYLIYFKKDRRGPTENIIGTKMAFMFIVGYTVLMSSLDTGGWESFRVEQAWVLIPLTGNLIHFYIDAFIWKFSDPHIRKEIGEELFVRAN